MRQAFVSILAIALLVGSAAGPALANGTATGRAFTVTVSGFPETVRVGDSMDGTIAVTLFGGPSLVRYQARFQVYVATAVGQGLVDSGSFSVRPGHTRTFNISMPVEPNATPGPHSVKMVVTIANESLSVGHEFTVLP